MDVYTTLRIPSRGPSRSTSFKVALVAAAYLLPFLLLTKALAAATACTADPVVCVNEGASIDTRAYAGQHSGTAQVYRGAKGRLSAASTVVSNPTENGFADWYGITDFSPPAGYGVTFEYAQSGFYNGQFNYWTGQPMTRDFNWYTEYWTYCNGHFFYGHGGYTPGTDHLVDVHQLDESYDCGSLGTVAVWGVHSWINGSLASTGWVLKYGSQFRADAMLEYYPYSWLSPVGAYAVPGSGTEHGWVCFGGTQPGNGCLASADRVKRLTSATWSDWGSSNTSILGSYGYYRSGQSTNYQFRAKGAY